MGNRRNITETPERWTILKITNSEGIFYKVFATWAGGYLNGDRWKINSGISEVKQDEDYYYLIGYSGSCYKCHKKGYGIATSYSRGVLAKILEQGRDNISVLEEEEDWGTIINI